jgi:uncharacterized protein YndB with AHSA1/START domain
MRREADGRFVPVRPEATEQGATMSTPTDIDRSAPVIAHHEIDIAAPLDVVWRLHTDVNAWPSWHTDITEARAAGDFAPGESFDWTSFDWPLTSTIYEVDAPNRVLWGGASSGITGIHEWEFTETPAGTHARTSESFAGEPVEADRAGMQQLLDGSLTSWLRALKTAAEARA